MASPGCQSSDSSGDGIWRQQARFSNNYRVFFGEDNPQLLAFEALENVYNKQDNILFVLAPADGQIFTQPTVAAISWLTTESWQLPFARRVDSHNQLSEYRGVWRRPCGAGSCPGSGKHESRRTGSRTESGDG